MWNGLDMIMGKVLLSIVCIVWWIRVVYLLFHMLVADAYNRKNNNAPYVETYGRHYERMKECLKPYLHAEQILYDLWCGDGGALRFFAKAFGMKKLVGYDIHSVAIQRGRLHNALVKQTYIELHHKNFLDVDIQQADIIYVFLIPAQLSNIKNRLQKNMRDDALIITNVFAFPDREPTHVHASPDGKSVIRIYKKT